MTRSERLKALVAAHDLTTEDLMGITGASRATVRAWLRPPSSRAHREPMEAVVRLVEILMAPILPAHKARK